MSNTISGGISFGGLGSGMDMNAIVDQLKKVQEIPINRYKLSQAEYEYRINALNAVMDVMRKSNDVLKKFNTVSKMFNLNVESSESAVASATILDNKEVAPGSYELDVKQIAKPSLFTSKTIFEGKDAVINNTGETQTFTYTYKGKTRTIDIPDGTSLDQFMKRINNDALNPGVKASLIKNGDGYMLQIQGNDTGANAELSISSTLPAFDGSSTLFTGKDLVLNSTGADSDFTYWYGGKERTFKVKDGMTAQEFVDEFNKDNKQPLKANLVQVGSDYKIEFVDRLNGNKVNLQGSSNLPMLGGKKFTGTGDVVNNTGSDKKINYMYMGKQYSVTVGDQATVQDVINKINIDNNSKHPDLVASFNSTTGQIEFTRQDATINFGNGKSMKVSFNDEKGKKHEFTVSDGISLKSYVEQFNKYSTQNKTGVKAELVSDGSGGQKIKYTDSQGRDVTVTSDNNVISGQQGLTLGDVKANPGFSSTLEGFGKPTIISGKQAVINSGTGQKEFSGKFNGQEIKFNVEAGATLEDFKNAFNTAASGKGVTAEIVESPSGYKLVYKDNDGKEIVPTDVNANGMNGIGQKGDNWYEQKAQDAIFTMNGWDQEFTSASNKLTEVIEGMEITIKSEGKTVLTVASDTSKVKENIKEVVDAINNIKKTILDLSKVDEDKETTNPEDGTMSSQLTWQKGSVLTGNYGVQLLLTEFNSIVTGSGGGFAKKQSVDDIWGDTFTVLSEIGISTNTNSGDDDFGLLVIDEEKLDEALKEDPDAVVELFSTQLSGSTTSSEFTVASTGLHAKPGKYDVTYDVVDGKATNVRINGVLAQTDPEYPGRWTVGDPKNDAAGVAIQFPNGGMADGNGYTGEIRIKQGKLNELSQFLTEELSTSTVPGVEQGKIPTIIDSYQQSIDNLQTKIDQETERLTLWEKRERLKFSRLEATLTQYNSTLNSISSMTAGMMG